jgi:hypothetical protein
MAQAVIDSQVKPNLLPPQKCPNGCARWKNLAEDGNTQNQYQVEAVWLDGIIPDSAVIQQVINVLSLSDYHNYLALGVIVKEQMMVHLVIVRNHKKHRHHKKHSRRLNQHLQQIKMTKI